MCASSAPPRSRGCYIFGLELDSAHALHQNQAHDRLWGQDLRFRVSVAEEFEEFGTRPSLVSGCQV
jgi:hypothetical protein